MTNTSHQLRERLKLKYMGDCKCGHCSLVPDQLVANAASELDALHAMLEAVRMEREDALPWL